jgi:hypothetical protein
MSVIVEVDPGCIPPPRGTGRVVVTPGATGEWWASWQGGADAGMQCLSAMCDTKAEALEWALAQPAAEWVIRRDNATGAWEHLR